MTVLGNIAPDSSTQNFVWKSYTGAYNAATTPKNLVFNLVQDQPRFFNYLFWFNSNSTAINAYPFFRSGFTGTTQSGATVLFSVSLTLKYLSQTLGQFNYGRMNVETNPDADTPAPAARFLSLPPPRLLNLELTLALQDTGGTYTEATVNAVPYFGYCDALQLQSSVVNSILASEEDSYFLGWLSSAHPCH